MKHEKDGDWGNNWLGINGSKLGPDGVGSGSFTVQSFNPAEGYDGVRFKDHFAGWNHPHLEEFGLRWVNEGAARVLGLMKGDYHADEGMLPYEQYEKAKQSPLIKLVEHPSARLFLGYINNQKPCG